MEQIKPPKENIVLETSAENDASALFIARNNFGD